MARQLLAYIFLCTALGIAPTPSQTVISCENANNTRASPRFRGENNGNAPPGNISKLPIRSLLYRGSQTRLYTRYMPWFGDSHPHDVGYRSDEPQQSARQVADMISRGLQGAIVDWYGPDSGLKNQRTIMLMKEAERQDNFEFAISEDVDSISECAKRGCDPTEKLIADLSYVAPSTLKILLPICVLTDGPLHPFLDSRPLPSIGAVCATPCP